MFVSQMDNWLVTGLKYCMCVVWVRVCVGARDRETKGVCVRLNSDSLAPTCVIPHFDLVLCNQTSFI